ncbi:MAG: hypothetical protein HY770_08175 [Chitinivibrionia bacterium]|nr:hypothetical protein [Chitinivibrionia bacterium]
MEVFSALWLPILLSAVFVFIASSILHMATPLEMKDPDAVKKFEQGPVGILTVLPNGKPKMGKSLVLWFLYIVFINIFVGYAAALGLERGTDYLMVFRVTGAIAVLAYVAAPLYEHIWKGQSCATTFRFIIGGVIYGLLTAGTFGWLWPAGM